MTHKVYDNGVTRDATPEEEAMFLALQAALPQQKANDVRQERNQKLTACDWTQLPDVDPAISSAWAPYRQALRDVPEQPGFPDNVQWPVPPT